MASAPAPGVEAAFPLPPSYYKRYANWTEESADESLKPPPPFPLDEPLMLFGALAFPPPNVINNPHLNGEPKPQLYPSAEKGIADPVAELKKLNRALLLNFLELLEVLIRNPALYQRKVDDLEVIFVNMHHLINSFRPHQARSYIISVLEEQVVKKRNAVKNLRQVFGNVEATMRLLAEQIDKEAIVPLPAEQPSAMEIDKAAPPKGAAQTPPAAAAPPQVSEANGGAAPYEAALQALKEQLDRLPVPPPVAVVAPAPAAAPTPSTPAATSGDGDDVVVTLKRTPKKR